MFWKENATRLNDNNHQQLKYVLHVQSSQVSYKLEKIQIAGRTAREFTRSACSGRRISRRWAIRQTL